MDCYTDLLIRIRAAPDPGRPYPVEAVVDGSAQHQGGTLSIDRDALLAQVLDPDAYGLTLSQALLSPPSSAPTSAPAAVPRPAAAGVCVCV